MLELSDKQVADFFRRSCIVVDGLCFMKAEEKQGFAAALDLDDEVWKVFPKIQARLLKSISGVTSGMDTLSECHTTKLALEGFEFSVNSLPICTTDHVERSRTDPTETLVGLAANSTIVLLEEHDQKPLRCTTSESERRGLRNLFPGLFWSLEPSAIPMMIDR